MILIIRKKTNKLKASQGKSHAIYIKQSIQLKYVLIPIQKTNWMKKS